MFFQEVVQSAEMARKLRLQYEGAIYHSEHADGRHWGQTFNYTNRCCIFRRVVQSAKMARKLRLQYEGAIYRSEHADEAFRTETRGGKQ